MLIESYFDLFKVNNKNETPQKPHLKN